MRPGLSGRSLLQSAITLIPAVMVVIGGWLHRWTYEDAFINLRIVDQILAGNGPVFNAGERVEAFTSPLWLAILVVIKATVGHVVAVEWAMVVLNLALAGTAFWLAARTTRRLQPERAWSVPIGLLVIAAVPVVWDFSTSGLEMPLVWLWLAGAWSALVGQAQGHGPVGGRRRTGALLVLGLGPLVRPDLGLMSVILLGAFAWMARSTWRRGVADIAVAFAPALAYQVFRMGYYASLVPSTALAKDSGSLHVVQGWRYALDLSRPYHLWLPLVVVLILIGSTLLRRRGDVRIAVGAMVLAASSHAAYMVVTGGDYMHGRLLLPALFALVLPAGGALTTRATVAANRSVGAVDPPSGRRSERTQPAWAQAVAVVAVAVAVAWAVPCARSYRYRNTPSFELVPISSWRELAPRPLVEPTEVSTFFWGGSEIAAAYERGERGTIPLLGDHVYPTGDRRRLVVELGSIGLAGYRSGIDVHVIDIGGLGEPLASRAEAHPNRPAGHRKEVDGEWYTARFGVPTVEPSQARRFGVRRRPQDDQKVAAARRALRCHPVSDLLTAIEAPLTPGRFLSNIWHSPGYTRLRIAADPRVAARRICDR